MGKPDAFTLQHRYEKNRELMSEELKNRIDVIDNQELMQRIEIEYNEDGDPVFYFEDNGKRIQGTGCSPRRDAGIWYENTLGKKNPSLIILFGSGFGYLFHELITKRDTDTIIILFEEDIYIFKQILYYFDMSALSERLRILVFVGSLENNKEELSQLIQTHVDLCSLSTEVVFSYEAVRNKKKEYEKIYSYVLSEMTLAISYLGNAHKDNLMGLYNTIYNANEILKSPGIQSIKEQYRKLPAFIISNGPSLDKNIEQLKKIKHRGLIFAAESSVLPLIKHGIKPDAIVVIERVKESYDFHFKGREYPKDTTLLALTVADPRIFRDFGGVSIPIFRYGDKMCEWVDQYLGDNSLIKVGGNVSHLAVELATYAGADPIILVGQDLAYGSNGDTHSKNSIYASKEGSVFNEQIKHYETRYVEGYDGKMLKTNRLWMEFKQGLEYKIEVHSDRTFIDATEGGAKIKGTKCDTLKHVISKYCKKPIDISMAEMILQNQKIHSMDEQKDKLEYFIKDLEERVKFFQGFGYYTRQRYVNCVEIRKDSRAEGEEQSKEQIEAIMDKNIAELINLLSDELIAYFMQQICFAEQYLKDRLERTEDKKEMQLCEWQAELFQNLNVLSKSMENHLESLSIYLKEVLEDLKKTSQEGEGDETN